MKIESPSRFILLTIIFVLIILGLGVTVTSKKVRPEEIRSFITKELEENFPNAIVKTSSVDFTLGITSIITINGLDLMLKKPRNFPLLHIDRLDFKIPFAALIFGNGKIEINARYPMIHLIKDKEFFNWSMATQDLVAKENKTQIPSIFKTTEININFSDIEIVQKVNNSNIRQQKIEKIILKDFGFNGPIAFEVLSKKISLGDEEHLTSLDLLIIGEMALTKKLFGGDISLNTSSTFTNIESKLLISKMVKSLMIESKLDYRKDHGFQGSVNISNEEMKMLSSKIKIKDSKIILSELNLDLNLKEVKNCIDPKFAKHIAVNSKENLNVQGDLEIGTTTVANLKFKSMVPITLNLGGNAFATNISGEVTSKSFLLNGTSQLGEGKFNFKVESSANSEKIFTNESFNTTIFSLTDLDLKSNGPLSIFDGVGGENLISFVWDYFEKINFPLKNKLVLTNVKINENLVDGEIDILTSAKGIIFKSNKFKIDKSDFKFNVAKLLVSDISNISLDVNFDRVKIDDLAKLIVETKSFGVSGLASGSIKGDIQNESYSLDTAFKITSGVFFKFDIDSILDTLIISKNKPEKTNWSFFKDGYFEQLNMKLFISQSKINLSQFEIFSKDNESEIQAKGYISFAQDTSNSLKLNFKSKRSDYLNINGVSNIKKALSLKLGGAGFDFLIQN